jgi:hypothetical protein
VLIAGSLTAASLADGNKHADTTNTAAKVAGAQTTAEAGRSEKKVTSKENTPVPAAASNPQVVVQEPAPLTSCTPKTTTNSMLPNNSNPTLRKLAAYDKVLCSGHISSSYIFIGLPRTNEEADEQALDLAIALQSFSASSVKPIVIVEPQYNGQKTDLSAFVSSSEAGVFDYFLSQVKSRGITDAQAGTWIMLPEPNLPEWSTLDPSVFAANFSSLGKMYKSYFPSAKLGMLLDSMTYTQNSYAGSGNRVSLQPYVSGLPAGLTDVFMLQGFPWVAPAGQKDAVVDASVFLRPAIAIEAATTLGVKEVWFNTGSYAAFYTNDATKTVKATAAERQAVLDGIAAQAKTVQKAGFSMGVMLFAEDKSSLAEAKDWSYWQGDTAAGTDGAKLFASFADKLTSQGVGLGVFDTY